MRARNKGLMHLLHPDLSVHRSRVDNTVLPAVKQYSNLSALLPNNPILIHRIADKSRLYLSTKVKQHEAEPACAGHASLLDYRKLGLDWTLQVPGTIEHMV